MDQRAWVERDSLVKAAVTTFGQSVVMYAQYFEKLGSGDAGTSCMNTDTLCSDGADITVGGTCATEDLTFTLNPLGRLATTGDTRTWGARDYPAVPNITLDGTTSDDLYFLSTDPIEGVVDFAMPMMPMMPMP